MVAEAELTARARLATIERQSRDSIIALSTEGTILSWNPASQRLFGYSAEEAIGQSLIFLSSEPGVDWQRIFNEILRDRQPDHDLDCLLRARDGRLIDISASLSSISDETGKVVGISAIFRDIGALRQAQREVKRLETLAKQREPVNEIGARASEIAHDLSNPLNAISMQAERILQRARQDPDLPVGSLVRPAEKMSEEIFRLSTRIRGLMEFARGPRVDLKDMDLNNFLLAGAEAWRPTTRTRGIELIVKLAESCLVKADEDKLRRVFDNLIGNAVDAIDKNSGQITLSTELREPNLAVISVADNGSGIAGGVEIFQIFSTSKASGTGLGLAVSRQIVQAHGGSIEFSRLSPHGTEFRVCLPLNNPSPS